METRDRGDDQIEGHLPRRGVIFRRRGGDIVTRDELQNFGELEASIGHHLGVLLLVGGESLDPLLGGRGWGVLDESPKELTTGNGHDIDIVAEDGEISGRNRERNLGESGVERFDPDDSIPLIVKAERAQQAVNLDIWVARPDADVVAVLVVDTGALDVEFQMNAVSIRVDVEELASDVDGSRERVLSIVYTLRSCQSAGGKFTCRTSR